MTIRFGKAFRMRGIGYKTLNIYPKDCAPTEDEKRFWEIVNAMKPEDAAVIGRVVDSEWYEQNDKDIFALKTLNFLGAEK